jgi:hypothetical protein
MKPVDDREAVLFEEAVQGAVAAAIRYLIRKEERTLS